MIFTARLGQSRVKVRGNRVKKPLVPDPRRERGRSHGLKGSHIGGEEARGRGRCATRRAQHVTQPAVVSNTITTLAEIRTVLAADAWPSRGLAVRAAIVAVDPRLSATLLRIADGQEMRAAHLWLRIANHLEEGEPLVAALAMRVSVIDIGADVATAGVTTALPLRPRVRGRRSGAPGEW